MPDRGKALVAVLACVLSRLVQANDAVRSNGPEPFLFSTTTTTTTFTLALCLRELTFSLSCPYNLHFPFYFFLLSSLPPLETLHWEGCGDQVPCPAPSLHKHPGLPGEVRSFYYHGSYCSVLCPPSPPIPHPLPPLPSSNFPPTSPQNQQVRWVLPRVLCAGPGVH